MYTDCATLRKAADRACEVSATRLNIIDEVLSCRARPRSQTAPHGLFARSMYGFYYHFNNLCFNKSQHHFSAAHVVAVVCFKLDIECRLLKLLVDHPMSGKDSHSKSVQVEKLEGLHLNFVRAGRSHRFSRLLLREFGRDAHDPRVDGRSLD